MQASIRVMPGALLQDKQQELPLHLLVKKKNVRSVDFDQLQQNLKRTRCLFAEQKMIFPFC